MKIYSKMAKVYQMLMSIYLDKCNVVSYKDVFYKALLLMSKQLYDEVDDTWMTNLDVSDPAVYTTRWGLASLLRGGSLGKNASPRPYYHGDFSSLNLGFNPLQAKIGQRQFY